ncbi:pyridoxamine 5'-phosphate oxidase family protein [Cupriavidus taiwanensis]|uniref:Putative Pyridoxamine 5'-phosphate oxidase-related, FMN-binding n=1 Tax=Cupriavidus taiwanensis TaxID=164546 RepID=A0A375JA67_9BURK|nr:pyridoxamine 5'-phosphate oxidase family protein [Cupriavidus taiwanensis]SPS01997.1 putative Pyridoxamine 5'-phosphate oxidase-related, FMN-binding [Cupriavidus taiwanensis]
MDLPTWPHAGLPFHAGELAAQQRAGKRERMAAAGPRVIRGEMPEQHRTFFAQLPFLLAGAVDADGMPWATLLVGPPGFAQTPDATHLRIDAVPLPGDPLAAALEQGARIGLLGIELPTRRRNRMNGIIVARDQAGLTVEVEQSFGNCPRYIQLRDVAAAELAAAPATWHGDALDAHASAWLRGADTLFIASSHIASPQDEGEHTGGVDVSHRGGKPGFIRVDDAHTLTFPDFNGNNFFNTIGNLLADPRAGIVVPDFADGSLLHVNGRAEVIWEGQELASYAGAERLVRLRVERVVRRERVLPLRFAFREFSPVLDDTGAWPER